MGNRLMQEEIAQVFHPHTFDPSIVPGATMEVTVLYGALGETGEEALEPGVILDDDWSSA